MVEAFSSEQVWLTIPEVAERLNIPLGRVHRLIEDHHLIEVRIDGVRKVPAEAIAGTEPLPSLRGTLLVLMDSGYTTQDAVTWLFTQHDSLGTTPLLALAAGRKTEIRRLAQALAF
ncbi:MAG: Rv2175c family DNA-binding protein [Micrococcales bacterium]